MIVSTHCGPVHLDDFNQPRRLHDAPKIPITKNSAMPVWVVYSASSIAICENSSTGPFADVSFWVESSPRIVSKRISETGFRLDKCLADFQPIRDPDFQRSTRTHNSNPFAENINSLVPSHMFKYMAGIDQVKSIVGERELFGSVANIIHIYPKHAVYRFEARNTLIAGTDLQSTSGHYGDGAD